MMNSPLSLLLSGPQNEEYTGAIPRVRLQAPAR
jgi:hypothetical protein